MKRTVLIYCLVLMSLFALPVMAEHRGLYSNNMQHYIGLSLGGGTAENIYGKSAVTAQLGGAANFQLNYELRKNKWIFGLGVEADYQYLRDTVADFTDSQDWTDKDDDAGEYEYVYEGYRETDHAIGLGIPVYFGREFGDYAYLLLGARFYLPLFTQSNTRTRLLTQGEYDWNIDPIRSEGINDYSVYGYYAKDEYRYAYTYKEYMRVGAWAEVGGYIPLERAKKTRLRAGVYAGYDWRLGSVGDASLADYSQVNTDPQTLSQDNLRANVRWNAVNTTGLVSRLPGNLEVGVRLTVLFDVTTHHEPCMCAGF